MAPQPTTNLAELEDLRRLCLEGRPYEVQDWIQQGHPLQLAPDLNVHPRFRSALAVALDTGQHSLCLLLLRSGYDPNLETSSPFDIAIRKRRKDLVELLFEGGGSRKERSIAREKLLFFG